MHAATRMKEEIRATIVNLCCYPKEMLLVFEIQALVEITSIAIFQLVSADRKNVSQRFVDICQFFIPTHDIEIHVEMIVCAPKTWTQSIESNLNHHHSPMKVPM